jgi:Homeodomain-like domain
MLLWPGTTKRRAGSKVMSRRRTAPLRPLTPDERAELERVSRAGSERADRAAHAKVLLAIADGALFSDAARCAGRRSPRAVALLVARFNACGLAALDRRHGGGPAIQYGAEQRERILAELRRPPDRERDGTATWSLTSLQRALRTAPDGLPGVSTQTILQTLWDAGFSWQQNRTWCQTGTVIRKRKAGPVEVTDPDTAPKKS